MCITLVVPSPATDFTVLRDCIHCCVHLCLVLHRCVPFYAAKYYTFDSLPMNVTFFEIPMRYLYFL